MGKAALVVMAAGIGSRFGGGIKQLEAVGPNGEIIIDYSIYDAVQAGFDKVVFVIRKDLEQDFKEVIGNRIEKKVPVFYAFQELTDIPEQFCDKFPDRKKPWGTGQAVLCCKELIDEPFLVINADDYYGKEAYQEAYRYLTSVKEFGKKDTADRICMVSFVLKNTLSENGGVTRGVCQIGQTGMLEKIVETHNILKIDGKAVVKDDDREREIPLNSSVSMNMWGFYPNFFSALERGFGHFLDEIPENELKKEFLIPTFIGDMLKTGEIEVKALESHDEWFGVTYKEDREDVSKKIRELVDKGLYM